MKSGGGPPRRRSVERALRGGLLRAMAAVAARGGDLPPLDGRPLRVLVVRLDAIGDVVLITGLIAALRARHPNIRIDVLTLEPNAPVLDHNPDVDSLILFRKNARGQILGARSRLRRAGYDAVIDAMVARDSVRSGTIMLMLATGAPARVGLVGREHDEFYSVRCGPRVPGEPHVETLRRLGAPFGVDDTDDLRPRLHLDDDERDAAAEWWAGVSGRGLRVLVNISAAHPRRRWPDDRFAAALAHLRERAPDARITVLSMPNDIVSATALAIGVGGSALAPTLREAIATIAQADLVFTPDTAVVHVASAFERPTVAMLIPGQLAFAPYRTAGASVVSDSDVLTDLPVARVLPALDAGLAAARAVARPAGRAD